MDEHWTDEALGERLREAYTRADFPREAISERIRATIERRAAGSATRLRRAGRHPVVPALLAAAAAVTLFVAGAEYGRRTESRAEVDPGVVPGTPLAIQASGTRYVADLARFADLSPRLPQAEREEARQAAVAVLYAAIVALQQEDDEELLEAAEGLMHDLRSSQRQSAGSRVIWF